MGLEVLNSLIDYIIIAHAESDLLWEKSENYQRFNLRKMSVSDISRQEQIWEDIKFYRAFISTRQFDFLEKMNNIQNTDNKITCRIKQLNSIEYKFHRYNSGELKGKMPISKCYNDLFGIRIVIGKDYSLEHIMKHIKEGYPKLKVIDSSKDGYKAIHVYFSVNNFSFPWELQVWTEKNESKNLISHKKYKQGYTIWEEKLASK